MIATFPAVKLRLFAITVHTQVFIIVAVLNVSPGSSCHEHRVSVPLSNLQQSQQRRQHALMGSRLTVLCRAHVEAITADVSGMQICSKWLTICHSFNPPPLSLALYLQPFMSLSVYASISLIPPYPQCLQCFHSPVLPLPLSPGACREGFGLLSGGSEGSFLL